MHHRLPVRRHFKTTVSTLPAMLSAVHALVCQALMALSARSRWSRPELG